MKFSEAESLLQEGDVLLFRANKFPSVGWLISTYTGGFYSHVGLAHKDGDKWYCVEQREFKGGRSVLLESQLHSTIDVYRVSPKVYRPHSNGQITWEEKVFDDATANAVTTTALSLTGSPYGWENIWNICKGYAPFFRLLRKNKNGDDCIAKAYVCSTVVVYSFRINYVDLCPNLSDARTTPVDVSRSSHLHNLFTIDPIVAN